MAYLGHHPCPKCSSRNNLAEYSDNYYCFGCGFYKPKTDISSLRNRLEKTEIGNKSVKGLDISKDIPLEPMKWLLKYGLTKEEMAGFGWNEERKLLILHSERNFWHGRNFSGNAMGAKYISSSSPPWVVFGMGSGNHSSTLVFVEDVISAIKIGRQAACSPMFGAIPQERWMENVRNTFKRIILFPDYDKASQAVKTSLKLKAQGIEVCSVVFDKLDPKELSDNEIKWKLKEYL